MISCTSFRVNPHSIVCLNVKELLARSWRHIWSLSDSNEIQTHNHLVCKRTLNHLAKPFRVWIHSETRMWHDNNIQPNAPLNHSVSLAKWLGVRLRTKWLCVCISLMSPIKCIGHKLLKQTIEEVFWKCDDTT